MNDQEHERNERARTKIEDAVWWALENGLTEDDFHGD